MSSASKLIIDLTNTLEADTMEDLAKLVSQVLLVVKNYSAEEIFLSSNATESAILKLTLEYYNDKNK